MPGEGDGEGGEGEGVGGPEESAAKQELENTGDSEGIIHIPAKSSM